MTAPTNPPDFQCPEGASQRPAPPDPATLTQDLRANPARRRLVKKLSGSRLQGKEAKLLAPLSLAAIQRWLDAQLREWPDHPCDQCLNSKTDTDTNYDHPDPSP